MAKRKTLSERVDEQRPPLSERMEWIDSSDGADCDLGGLRVEIQRYPTCWELYALGTVDTFEAADLPAAKLEALRIVQRAILAAAEAWAD